MAIGFKTGGRQKGTPNKLTSELKEMILGALSDSGGREYLTNQAKANPTAFLTLLGKVLPMTLSSDPENPFEVSIGQSDRELISRYLTQKDVK